jgi:hypothetical protein
LVPENFLPSTLITLLANYNTCFCGRAAGIYLGNDKSIAQQLVFDTDAVKATSNRSLIDWPVAGGR